MRFKAETYDAELDALLDEFVDARAIEAAGDEQVAWEQIGLLLGIWPGDVIEIDADGYVVTSASSEEIHRRITIARRYKALPPIPEFPFEREWPDRLRTLTDFLTMGPLVLESFDWTDSEELERLRAMAPELWALLLEAYGTPKQRRTLL